MKKLVTLTLLGLSFSSFAGQLKLPDGNLGDALVRSVNSTAFVASFGFGSCAAMGFLSTQNGSVAVPLGLASVSYGVYSFFCGLERELSPEGAALRNKRSGMINGLMLAGVGAWVVKQYIR